MSKNAVAKKDDTLPAFGEDLERFAGLGTQDISTEDMATPFLRILADLSPQVQKRKAEYVPGAEPGMIFNTVRNEVYDGEEGVLVVPCHYYRRYVEWTPRESGGGYVASYEPDDPIIATASRGSKGEDLLENGNLLANTAHFFVLQLFEEEGPQPALVTMSSTQLKKSRTWNSQMNSVTGKGASGNIYTVPTMVQVYRLRTVPEENDKGSWYGWSITRERFLDYNGEEKSIFEQAVTFHKSVRAGEVEVRDKGLSSEESEEKEPF